MAQHSASTQELRSLIIEEPLSKQFCRHAMFSFRSNQGLELSPSLSETFSLSCYAAREKDVQFVCFVMHLGPIPPILQVPAPRQLWLPRIVMYKSLSMIDPSFYPTRCLTLTQSPGVFIMNLRRLSREIPCN